MVRLTSDILGTRYFSKLANGERLKGVVRQRNEYSYAVDVFDEKGEIIHSSRIKNPTPDICNGIELEVRLVNGYVEAFTKEECEEEKRRYKEIMEAREKRREKERLERERFWNNLIEQSNDFYNKLDIPVKYTPVVKMVMSGLTENSMGNGVYKNTVTHLRVEEDFTDGKRFSRESGDCLCNYKPSGRKRLWFEESSFSVAGKIYPHHVTCKGCLKVLRSKGWLKE